MTRETESRPSGEGLGALLILLITIAFLGTAAALGWDTWAWKDSDRPSSHRPVGADLPQHSLVRTAREPVVYCRSENCSECHSKREYRQLWNDWTKGGHKDVECEVCHGPAGDHGLSDVDPRPKMPITLEKLAKPRALCLGCHSEILGRQTTNLPIDPEKHLAEFKVNKEDNDYEQSRQCLSCHDAHRPVKK